MAEIDTAAMRRFSGNSADFDVMKIADEIDRLRAQIAAVEVLCDRTSTPGSGYRQIADHHARLTVAEVRAALGDPT